MINSLIETIDIEIYVCASIVHSPDWIETTSHPTHNLWLVTRGTVSLDYNGETHILKKGDAFLFSPKTHYCARSINGSVSFIYTHFNLSTLKNQNFLSFYNADPYISADVIKKYYHSFVSACKVFKPVDSISYLELKGALILLLSQIIRAKMQNLAQVNTDEVFLSDLLPVLEYIENNYTSPISVSQLAKMAAMSEKYFIVYFKNSVGITPHQYIIEQRMKRAYDYINLDHYSVRRTAELLGYPDQYSFSKAFKSKYGFPPTKIKNIQKEKEESGAS